MDNQFVNSIRLSEEDSIEFACSMFRPTKKDIEVRKNFMEHINNNVRISKTTNHGFEAEIRDLDLSFLETKQETYKLDMVSIVSADMSKKNVFNSSGDCINTITVVETVQNYRESSDNGYLPCAA